MTSLLKQSTAATVKVGPFVDSTDGDTAETGLTITQAEVRLAKNGGNIAQKNEATSLTHDEAGLYDCPLDATDTNTLGLLTLFIHESGALYVRHDFMILPANVYDSWFSTDKLDVSLVEWLGVAPLALASQRPQVEVDAYDSSLDFNATQKASVNTEADTAATDFGALKPTTAGRTLDVSATGEAGLDLANVNGALANTAVGWIDANDRVAGVQGTINTLDGLDTAQDTQHTTTQGRLPAALVAGKMDSDATAISGDATAADNLEATFDGTGYSDADGPATQAQADRNADLTESQFGAHIWQGNYYYVDPVNGDTHASGNRGGRGDPYSLVQDCHDNAVTDSNHDIIFLVAGGAGLTTLTEDVTLSKRYLFIRGPGLDFLWTRSGNGNTITITADGIELSGFQLETAGTGSGNGIDVTDADFLRAHNLWINATRGDGIHLLRADNCQIHDNVFTDTGQAGSGEGIHIVGTAGNSNYNIIHNNSFRDCAGDAILVEDGTTLNTHIYDNHIEGSTGYGINIGASSTDALLLGNLFGNNSSGTILDGGTTTVSVNNEQWAKHSIATEVRLAELDAANIPADIDALAVTLAALNDLSSAQVNTEMVDVLAVDTFTEPGSVPAATASIEAKISWLFTLARNKITQTATTQTLRDDADGADIATASVSDNGTTATRGEFS